MKIILYSPSVLSAASIFFQLALCKKYETMPYYTSVPKAGLDDNYCFNSIFNNNISYIESVSEEDVDEIYILNDPSNMSTLRKFLKSENIGIAEIMEFLDRRSQHIDYINQKFGDKVRVFDIDITNEDYKENIISSLEIACTENDIEAIYFENIKEFINFTPFSNNTIKSHISVINAANNIQEAIDTIEQ